MFMPRFLFATCLIAVPVAIAAKDIILIQNPPVYQPEDSASGVFIDNTAMPPFQRELRQQVQIGPDGEAYVLMSMMDGHGNVRTQLVFDPRTWHHKSSSKVGVKTITHTCSSNTLYPITIGKVYECASTMQVNDRVLKSHSRVVFNEVERGGEGDIVGFCAVTVSDDGEMNIKTRTCFSPDGKWMRSMQILKAVWIQKN